MTERPTPTLDDLDWLDRDPDLYSDDQPILVRRPHCLCPGCFRDRTSVPVFDRKDRHCHWIQLSWGSLDETCQTIISLIDDCPHYGRSEMMMSHPSDHAYNYQIFEYICSRVRQWTHSVPLNEPVEQGEWFDNIFQYYHFIDRDRYRMDRRDRLIGVGSTQHSSTLSSPPYFLFENGRRVCIHFSENEHPLDALRVIPEDVIPKDHELRRNLIRLSV